MNASTENQTSPHFNDLPDRLLDIALTEVVGGKSPPDLSAQISAATTFRQPAVVAQAPRTRGTRAFWASLAAAVMLLIGVTIVVIPQVQSARERASKGLAKADRLGGTTLQDRGSTASFEAGTKGEKTIAKVNEASTDLAHNFEVPGFATATSVDRSGPGNSVPQPKSQDHVSAIAVDEGARYPAAPIWEELSQRPKERFGSHDSQLRDKAYGDYAGGPVDHFALAPEGGPGSRPMSQEKSFELGTGQLDAGAQNSTAAPKLIVAYGGEQYPRPHKLKELEESRGGFAFNGHRGTREGTGARLSGDTYNPIVENSFVKAEGGAAVSTFSIDVDTASYANVRQFLMEMSQLPPPDAVRIEELVNYFHYDYAPPAPGSAGGSADDTPFAAHVEVTSCPWNSEHRLARIGIKGREMDRNKRPQSNLVFLVDVSGSMNEPAKLPLVVYGLEQLTRELGENDHIAIVVYAGTEGVVLPSTSGSKQDTILAALAKLQAGGSTAGGAGIQLAYQIAEDNFIKGGTNRVILCTDGDFNVGVTSTAELQRMVEKKAKETGVFISTLGFGRGNLNDAMMVAISDHGNGNYHYIDNRTEARRVLVQEMTGTLVTIAKDVKIQVEFNPAQVAGYRLIGYEKRMLRTEDFNDDKKDAGEIGAGHTVTALYEIVPADKKVDVSPIDRLKYQQPATEADDSKTRTPAPSTNSNELLTLKMRYKAPDGDTSKKLEWPITDDGKSFAAASNDTKFAASVAGFGLLLRDSQYKGNLTYAAVQELAQGGIGEDPHGYRKEFLEVVRRAKELRHE